MRIWIAGLGLATALIFMSRTQSISESQITGRPAPELVGDIWLNSMPKKLSNMRGKVVLVEFWTFGCWNCENVMPHMKKWHSMYGPNGLEIIAIHTPETEQEKDLVNLRGYLRRNEIEYPVLVDNSSVNWDHYDNRYWPSVYLIDKAGRLRHIIEGDSQYEKTEKFMKELLAED